MHTKGPWRADCSDHVNWVLDSQGNYLVETVTEDSSDLYEKSERRRQGNVVLMAAAPDLLAALKALIEICDDRLQFTYAGRRLSTDARAAIARAEGRMLTKAR
jgi:hypothetical protein